jgi:hypothetical protein
MSATPPQPKTVLERVSFNWPGIENDLLQHDEKAAEDPKERPLNYAAAKATAINDAIEETYARFAPEEDAPESVDDKGAIVQQYIADKATLSLMGVARSFYLKRRTSESKNTNQGGTVSNSFTDPLGWIDALETQLNGRVSQREPLVVRVLSPIVTDEPQARPLDVPVASRNKGLDWLDPVARAKERY